MKNQDWEIPRNLRPDPDDYSFDLERALKAVVSLKTYVPADAFTTSPNLPIPNAVRVALGVAADHGRLEAALRALAAALKSQHGPMFSQIV